MITAGPQAGWRWGNALDSDNRTVRRSTRAPSAEIFLKRLAPIASQLIGVAALLILLGLAATPAHGAPYKIRPIGIVGGRLIGGFDLSPIQYMLGDLNAGSSRPAMSMNGLGQVVEETGIDGTSLLWLPAPAYGLAAGYHYLPAGFHVQRIGAAGHVVGIMRDDYTAAIWYNGALTHLGKMGMERVVNVDVTFRGVVVGTAINVNPTPGGKPSYLGKAFIAPPAATQLKPMFANATAPTWVFRANFNADVVGCETPPGQANRLFVTQGGDMLRPGSITYPDQSPVSDLYGQVINAWGDIAGIQYGRSILAYKNNLFVYGLSGQTDLPMAPTLLVSANTFRADAFALNSQGQALCVVDPTEVVYLYQHGTLTKLDNLIPPNSGWQSLVGADLNDNRWIIGEGTYNGQIDQAFLMVPVGLDARLSATPSPAPLGAPVIVTLTLSNETAAAGSPMTLINVAPNFNPAVDGSGGLVYANGPRPAQVNSLAPGATAAFTYRYTATAPGAVRLFAIGHAFNPGFLPSDYTSTSLDIGGLAALITANPRRVGTNEIITVVLTARNDATTPYTAVSPDAPLVVEGNGKVALVSGPTPATVGTLAPNTLTAFEYEFRAVGEGSVNFKGRVRGVNAGGTTEQSPEASSNPVNIGIKGDLLIKRDVESTSQFGLDDIYQTVAAGGQIRTNAVGPKETSEFQVRIQNDDKQPRVYRLAAIESGPDGWDVKYLLGAQDISALVRTFTGAEFPALDAHQIYTITVQMTPTNAPLGSTMRSTLALSDTNSPAQTLDVVEAVTELALEIIVNSSGDLPQDQTVTCCCDTGHKLADGVTPECTLRAAIEFANKHAGKDIIKFKIPSDDPGIVQGVPSIRPKSPLPDITDPVSIDGWSQNASATTPPVELSGLLLNRENIVLLEKSDEARWAFNYLSGVVSGLVLVAGQSEIRGLAINYFTFAGIELKGPENVIQGNFIGTDATGTIAMPNGSGGHDPPGISGDILPPLGCEILVRSAFNRIGGTDLQSRNVISGTRGAADFGQLSGGRYRLQFQPPGILLTGVGAAGNIIEGNIIGLDRTGLNFVQLPPDAPVGVVEDGAPLIAHELVAPIAGIFILGSPGNLIGGTQPESANVIAGNLAGIEIVGQTATENQITGNFIGPGLNGATIGGNVTGVAIGGAPRNHVGGNVPGAANVISLNTTGIAVGDSGADGNEIKGNFIGVKADGVTQLGYKSLDNGVATTESNGTGIRLNAGSAGTVISENIIGFSGLEAVWVGSSGNSIVKNKIFSNWTVARKPNWSAGGAVKIWDGNGNRISDNSIYSNNGGVGIVLANSELPLPNDDGDLDEGPNHLQNYPQLRLRDGAILSGDQLMITGVLSTRQSGGDYVIEFFASDQAAPSGFGEGRTFLGAITLTVGFSGLAAFDTKLTFTESMGAWLTATATDPDGSTSELSKAVVIQPCPPGLKGICPGLEQNVPSLNPSAPKPQGLGNTSTAAWSGRGYVAPASNSQLSPIRAPLAALGDGNGDGVLDAQQDNVASLPSIAGVWVTLAAPTGTVLENVTPTGPPDFTSLPQDYIFPIGFLGFGITNLSASGVIVMTNFLHLDAATNLSSPYVATTFFNYGATADNPTPHWYEFNFDGTTGAELLADRVILHFRDGARGDDDLSVNGEITTIGAPAYRLPLAPQLFLVSMVVGLAERLGLDSTTSQFTTNQVPVVSSVLSWPASATNYVLQFADNLAPRNALDFTSALSPFIFWQTMPDSPAVVNGQNVLTNTATHATRFYRLRQF